MKILALEDSEYHDTCKLLGYAELQQGCEGRPQHGGRPLQPPEDEAQQGIQG
jgi:hypothetical protein